MCARTYTGGKGYCPVDAVELTPEHEVDLPQRGHGHELHDHHAGAVPGPDRDRAVRAVHVWLDGTDVVLGYQALLDTPNDDVRIGIRVAAMWASDAEKADHDPRAEGNLVGWMPTGEARRHRPRPREQDLLMEQVSGERRTTSNPRAARSEDATR